MFSIQIRLKGYTSYDVWEFNTFDDLCSHIDRQCRGLDPDIRGRIKNNDKTIVGEDNFSRFLYGVRQLIDIPGGQMFPQARYVLSLIRRLKIKCFNVSFV